MFLLSLMVLGHSQQAIRIMKVPNKTRLFGVSFPDSTVIFEADSLKLYIILPIGRHIAANDNMDTVFSNNWFKIFPAGIGSFAQTITLYGDATGSGTTSITVTVTDDSHNHVISNVDGLQNELTSFWEKEVALDDENDWTLPFSIKTTAVIFYNGSPLRPAQWYGEGSSILGVNLVVKKHDHLVLIN